MPFAWGCPSSVELQRFLRGDLPEANAVGLESHVEVCATCQDLLYTLDSPDKMEQMLRAAAAEPEATPPHFVDPVIANLDRLCATVTQTRPALAGGEPGQDTEINLSGMLAPPQANDEIGRLGNYRVLGVLGQGGMGIVFRAEDVQLRRLVALKVIRPRLAANPLARQRFLREARSAAALEHDHVVPLYHVGEERGVPFLAFQLLKGESLEARLKRQEKLSLAEVLRIGCEVAQGLAAAHAQGVIHRDIKPANIWLESKQGKLEASTTGGRVKILDFGLAGAITEAQETSDFSADAAPSTILTQAGAIFGTPTYMSPEQARGQKVDTRTDLFSLGAVLYRMTTGRTPFPENDAAAVLTAIQKDEPVAPQRLNPTIPLRLSRLIMTLLAKSPAERPNSASAVAESLANLAAQGRGRQNAAASAVVAAILVVAGIVGWLWMANKENETVTGSFPQQDLAIDFPATIELDLGDNVKLELMRIPAGEFMMGSPEGEKDARESERPQHRVRITRTFYLGKYEVTQEQYSRFKENTSDFCSTGESKAAVSGLDTRRFPVDSVSWHEATAYCMALNDRHRKELPAQLHAAGYRFSLPTEAQWEYACRADTRTPFHFGEILNGKEANCRGDSPYGTNEKGPSLKRTCEVGRYSPNSFGLYDMHGNVWEWCTDRFDVKFYETSPPVNPENKTPDPWRVCRGGSFGYWPWACRSAVRHTNQAFVHFNTVGFRVALLPPD